MTTATAVSPFYERLERCRLLSPEQLAAACATVGQDEPALSRYLVQQGLMTRFQARQLRAGEARFRIDKYIVVDYIGRGAHCQVFKARHSTLPNRFVALKIFEMGSLHQQTEHLARFRKEVEIVAGLDHPAIVRAYDVVESRRQLCLVLEYVDGSDLAQLVKQFGPLPVGDAVNYIVQAAAGLAYAHRRGIVHRDIKPANLLLARDGIVKLADLGLAQALSGDGVDLSSDKCLGTPAFMAPEQAESHKLADVRSDLYSLGATLYHLLTGELPIDGTSYLHQLRQLLSTAPRPLADARADAPAELCTIVDRLRSRNPADRPASADEVIDLLSPFARRPASDSNPGGWDGRRKASLVLLVMQGRVSAAEACAASGVELGLFEQWRQQFMDGAVQALDPARSQGQAEVVRALYAKIGAQAMEIELLKSQHQAPAHAASFALAADTVH